MKKIVVLLLFLVVSQSAGYRKYELPCKAVLLNVSLDSALSQVNTLEKTGNNDGEVEKYLKSAGLKSGMPYCAAGVYWCFFSAARDLKLSAREIPILKTGAANKMFNHAASAGAKVKYSAEKHDLIIWRKKASWKGHVERIFRTGKAGWVKTAAFNVKKYPGKKAPQGVFIKKRNIFHPLGRLLIRGLIGFKTGEKK